MFQVHSFVLIFNLDDIMITLLILKLLMHDVGLEVCICTSTTFRTKSFDYLSVTILIYFDSTLLTCQLARWCSADAGGLVNTLKMKKEGVE